MEITNLTKSFSSLKAAMLKHLGTSEAEFESEFVILLSYIAEKEILLNKAKIKNIHPSAKGVAITWKKDSAQCGIRPHSVRRGLAFLSENGFLDVDRQTLPKLNYFSVNKKFIKTVQQAK